MDCSEAGRLTHPLDPPAVGGEGVTRCRDLAEEKSQEGSWPTKRRGTAHTFSTCDAISCSVPARVIFSLPPLFARVQLAPLAPRLSLLGSPRPVCGTGGLPRGGGGGEVRRSPATHRGLIRVSLAPARLRRKTGFEIVRSGHEGQRRKWFLGGCTIHKTELRR